MNDINLNGDTYVTQKYTNEEDFEARVPGLLIRA